MQAEACIRIGLSLFNYQDDARSNKLKINHLMPTCHYMYRQFNIQQFHVLPTQCIYVCVLCGSENKQRLFPYTALTD